MLCVPHVRCVGATCQSLTGYMVLRAAGGSTFLLQSRPQLPSPRCQNYCQVRPWGGGAVAPPPVSKGGQTVPSLQPHPPPPPQRSQGFWERERSLLTLKALLALGRYFKHSDLAWLFYLPATRWSHIIVLFLFCLGLEYQTVLSLTKQQFINIFAHFLGT